MVSRQVVHTRQIKLIGMPEDQSLLASVGQVAVAHGQLEHILRMTVKTLSGLSTKEALDATQQLTTREVRAEIRKLFKSICKDSALQLKLESYLERARKESEKRNHLLHRPWAMDPESNWLTKDEFHNWEAIPTSEKFVELRNRIYSIIEDLNEARLHGFIGDAVSKSKKLHKQETP